MRQVDSAYLKMLARMHYQADYLFRLVTQDGKVYPIPSRAVLNAPASAAVDSPSTWEMPVSIMASMMPRGVDPQQYHGIEVDRLMKGNRMPYFRGLVDEVRRGWRKENGVTVETIEMQAFGVLQRAKGYRVDSLRIDPITQDGIIKLMGLAKTKTWRPGGPVGAGLKETIPFGGSYLGLPTIYTDDSKTVVYPYWDYIVDTTKIPFVITWDYEPAPTRVIEYYALERFIIPYGRSVISHSFFTLPEGRDYDDLYHTWVEDFDPTPSAPRIRVADRSGWGTHLHPGLVEFAALVTADGATHILALEGPADADGWIPMYAVIPENISVGDSIRLCTTEAISAWDDDRIYQFFADGAGAMGGDEWNRTLLTPYPTMGIAVPTPRYWQPGAEQVWIDSLFPGGVGYVREDVDANRIEEVFKRILTTETGLFQPSEVITEPTGVYVKNRTWSGTELTEILSDGKDQAMSPSTFIHDTQDGKITIKPYRQKIKPDWVLRGIQSIEETEVPEPVTAVTVIAEASEPVNLAGEWLYQVVGATDQHCLTDTIKSGNLEAKASDAEKGFLAVFQIPKPEPSTIHPIIDSIRITGTGLVTIYLAVTLDDGPIYGVPGYNFAPLEKGSLEVKGEDLARVMTAQAGYLFIYFLPITDGSKESLSISTPAACSEIEILTKKAGYWRAALTDDTNLTPADQGPDKFGTIWRQPDPSKRMSYRYAPTSYLKRVQTLYPDKAREKVLSMTAISQQDTRDYSERHQDEYLRAGKKYTVIAPYDDRAELGDTVHVAWEEFRKALLLWGIQGPANPREVMATYTFHDYYGL